MVFLLYGEVRRCRRDKDSRLVLQFLASRGVPELLNARGERGDTPLHLAAGGGDGVPEARIYIL